jgi:hypothetical protein
MPEIKIDGETVDIQRHSEIVLNRLTLRVNVDGSVTIMAQDFGFERLRIEPLAGNSVRLIAGGRP